MGDLPLGVITLYSPKSTLGFSALLEIRIYELWKKNNRIVNNYLMIIKITLDIMMHPDILSIILSYKSVIRNR